MFFSDVLADTHTLTHTHTHTTAQEFGLLTKQVVYLNRYVSTLAPGLDLFSAELLSGEEGMVEAGGGVEAAVAE